MRNGSGYQQASQADSEILGNTGNNWRALGSSSVSMNRSGTKKVYDAHKKKNLRLDFHSLQISRLSRLWVLIDSLITCD